MSRRLSEFVNKCDLCKKKKKAHLYYRLVNNGFVHLCKECWETMECAKENNVVMDLSKMTDLSKVGL